MATDKEKCVGICRHRDRRTGAAHLLEIWNEAEE